MAAVHTLKRCVEQAPPEVPPVGRILRVEFRTHLGLSTLLTERIIII